MRASTSAGVRSGWFSSPKRRSCSSSSPTRAARSVSSRSVKPPSTPAPTDAARRHTARTSSVVPAEPTGEARHRQAASRQGLDRHLNVIVGGPARGEVRQPQVDCTEAKLDNLVKQGSEPLGVGGERPERVVHCAVSVAPVRDGPARFARDEVGRHERDGWRERRRIGHVSISPDRRVCQRPNVRSHHEPPPRMPSMNLSQPSSAFAARSRPATRSSMISRTRMASPASSQMPCLLTQTSSSRL